MFGYVKRQFNLAQNYNNKHYFFPFNLPMFHEKPNIHIAPKDNVITLDL